MSLAVLLFVARIHNHKSYYLALDLRGSITEASVAVRGQRAVQIVSNPGNGRSGGLAMSCPKP